MMLILWGLSALGVVVLTLLLMWGLGNPTKAILGTIILVSGLSIGNSLGIHPLSVPLVLFVGYLASPLIRGIIEGYSGKNAGPDRHQPSGPA